VFFYCLAKSTAIKPLIAANTPFLLAMMPNYFSVTSVKFTMTAAALTENEPLTTEDFLQLRINSKKDTTIIDLKERGRERMLEFGSQIYEAIQAKKSIYVLYKREYVPIFTDEPEQEAFRITMSDFYRLTRVF
jgi:hypothetical protein